MKIIEKEAKNENEAIEKVLRELGINDRELISHVEIIGDVKKPKLLPFNAKKIKVRVVVLSELEKKAINLIKDLFSKMDVEIKDIDILEYDDTNVKLNVKSSKDSLLIGRRGKTLDALQYLINVIVNRGNQTHINITLDVGGYRNKRIKTLQRLAKSLATKVKETGKEYILEPMNPFERKIIHSTLQDYRDIDTESVGSGIFKKVKIKIKK